LYLVYVDDSGKPQQIYRHNKYFCLSAVIICERDWLDIDTEIVRVKNRYNISEIRTRNIYTMEKEFSYLKMNPDQRYIILGDIFSMISKLNVILITSAIDKQKYYVQYIDDAAEYRAWIHLFERCDMCISDMCKKDGYFESGLIIIDHHTSDEHDELIKDYLREVRISGSGYHRFEHMIEEPLFTPSKWRNIIQLANAVAYCSAMYLLNNEFFVKQFLTIQSKFRTDQNGDISMASKYFQRKKHCGEMCASPPNIILPWE
jgi:hypothetical protein